MAQAGLALAVALVCAACTGGDRTAGPDATDATAAPERPATGTSPEADDTGPEHVGAGVVVAEQGFSVFPDPVDPADQLGAFGVVVENSDEALLATGVLVTVRLLDPSGVEMLTDTTMLNGIQPRARMAVGRMLVEPIDPPGSLEVDIDVSAWLTPADADGAIVSASAVTEPDDSGGLRTTFEVWSAWPTDEEGVDVTALYRSGDGRILGAEMTTLDEVPAGGSAEGAVRLLAAIPDLEVTEVLVGRGFAAHTSG